MKQTDKLASVAAESLTLNSCRPPLLSMNQISFVHAKSIACASHARVGKPYRRTAIGSSRNQKLNPTKAILGLGKHKTRKVCLVVSTSSC